MVATDKARASKAPVVTSRTGGKSLGTMRRHAEEAKKRKRDELLGIPTASLRKLFWRGRTRVLPAETIALGRRMWNAMLLEGARQAMICADVAGVKTVTEDHVRHGLSALGIQVLGHEISLQNSKRRKTPKLHNSKASKKLAETSGAGRAASSAKKSAKAK